jgi:hypothetical protein
VGYSLNYVSWKLRKAVAAERIALLERFNAGAFFILRTP